MLIPRIITSIVLFVLLLLALFAPNFYLLGIVFAPFELFVALAVGIALWEALRLTLLLPTDDLFVPGIIFSVIVCILFLVRNEIFNLFQLSDFFSTNNLDSLFGLHTIGWFVFILPFLFVQLPKSLASGLLLTVLTVFSLFVNWLALVEAFNTGWVFLVSLLATVWVADIGAYFFGRFMGRYKLAPRISPGKTIEGALGGIVAVLVYSIFAAQYRETFSYYLFLSYGEYTALLCLLLISCLAISGDLFESWLKRRSGRKDSSSVLPGHGGVYDRIDALLPVLPFAVLLC